MNQELRPPKQPRIRHIKPEFFLHDGLYELEEKTKLPVRLALIGLWCCTDCEGRFEWRPRQLKLHILPYDLVDFAQVLNALAAAKFLFRYEVNGKVYGFIPSFGKHQHINRTKEPRSYLPPPPDNIQAAQEPPTGSPQAAEDASVSVSGSVSVLDREREAGETEAPAIPGQESTLTPTDADIQELCDLVSSYSGNVVKPDWHKYAKAILRGVSLEKLKPLLEWMYVESGFWNTCTFNTKNLYDHLCAGNLLKKYNAVKKLKKAQAAKAKQEALGSDPTKPEYQQKDAGKFFARAKENVQ